jgi:hypothetical protein
MADDQIGDRDHEGAGWGGTPADHTGERGLS